MGDAPPSLEPGRAEILATLKGAGVVAPDETIDLQPLARKPQRCDAPSSHAFKVLRGGQPWCHLTVGTNLHEAQRHTSAFAQACPDITCRPLFFTPFGDRQLLGVEWFAGTSLEERIREGTTNAEQARVIVGRLCRALAATRQPSTSTAASEEYAAFAARVTGSRVFSTIDHVLLREVILPFVRDRALRGAMETCLTNGDFVARNVLVADDGGIRLIDCEFAQRTHFFAADAWRWREFSNLPAPLRDIGPGDAGVALEPWVEVYSILQHLVLVEVSQGPAVAVAEARVRLPRLFAVISAADERLRASLLWPIFSTAALHQPPEPVKGWATAQLFWSSSAAFSESESRRISYPSCADALLAFVVPRGAAGVMHLRLDPMEAPGLVRISSIQIDRIVDGRRVPVLAIRSAWDSLQMIRGLLPLRADCGLWLLSLDIDPSLLLPAITLADGPADLLVEIRLRHDSDLSALPALLPK